MNTLYVLYQGTLSPEDRAKMIAMGALLRYQLDARNEAIMCASTSYTRESNENRRLFLRGVGPVSINGKEFPKLRMTESNHFGEFITSGLGLQPVEIEAFALTCRDPDKQQITPKSLAKGLMNSSPDIRHGLKTPINGMVNDIDQIVRLVNHRTREHNQDKPDQQFNGVGLILVDPASAFELAIESMQGALGSALFKRTPNNLIPEGRIARLGVELANHCVVKSIEHLKLTDIDITKD